MGKSTVAANLAISLAKKGYRVGLADADIYGPSIPTLFNIENEQVMATEIDGKNLMLPFDKFGIKMMSVGFFVEKDQPMLWRGPMAANTLVQMLTETHWGELDFMVLDMPPGTGDIQLSLVQQFSVSGSVFVCTPQQLAVADVRRAVNMFTNDQVAIPIFGLVENYFWTCRKYGILYSKGIARKQILYLWKRRSREFSKRIKYAFIGKYSYFFGYFRNKRYRKPYFFGV